MSADFDVYLASTSPRRAELLRQVGIRFEVVGSQIDESPRAGESAIELAVRLARTKAMAGLELASRGKPAIGADTVVTVDEYILGKPATKGEAEVMLERLCGLTHRVITAVAVCDSEHMHERTSETRVTFRNLSRKERHQYVSIGESVDKAGGYAIQGFAACFVTDIQGSYSGVVGLPLAETAELLSHFGIHCLDPLR